MWIKKSEYENLKSLADSKIHAANNWAEIAESTKKENKKYQEKIREAVDYLEYGMLKHALFLLLQAPGHDTIDFQFLEDEEIKALLKEREQKRKIYKQREDNF